MSEATEEYNGEEIALASALVDASRSEDIPPEELADIRSTLGPLAVYGEAADVGEAPEEESTDIFRDFRQAQVLVFVQAAGAEIENNWMASSVGHRNKAPTTRIASDIYVAPARAAEDLVSLEEREYVEIKKGAGKGGDEVIKDVRITEQGTHALEQAREKAPNMLAQAEEKLRERLVWQLKAMREEIYRVSDELGRSREYAEILAEEVGTDNPLNPMTADVDGLNLTQLMRLPGKLERIQVDLEEQLDLVEV